MTTMAIRDVSLFVKVIGHGYPLLLMHGGPSLDHTSRLRLQPLAGQFSLALYVASRRVAPEEERMLAKTFGAAWDEYCRRVWISWL